MANARKIKKLMDTGTRHRGTSVLLYGPPKGGKGVLAAQLAKHYRLWWLDIENGAEVLFNESVVDPNLLDNIELFQIPDYKGKPLGIEYAMKLFKGETMTLCDEHNISQCPKCKLHNARNAEDQKGMTTLNLHELDVNKDIVILDSITQLTRSATAYITNKLLKGEDAKFEFDHYRLQNVYIDLVMDMCQAGLFNVVCMTHEQGIEQTDGTEKITPSGSTKNYARTLAKNFDAVVYVHMNGTHHKIASQTSEAPKAVTGMRMSVSVERDGIAALFNKTLRTEPPAKQPVNKAKAGATTTPSKLQQRLRQK